MYYAKVPKHGHTLNTSRLAVPLNFKGAVVLDATASSNVTYELFKKASVWPIVSGVRSYRNVRLNVCRQINVGKLSNEGDTLLPVIVDDLNQKIGRQDVLFVTHQSLEAKVIAMKTDFRNRVGHWGAVDGSNHGWNAIQQCCSECVACPPLGQQTHTSLCKA